jgi:thymidylate synthase (FAD)
MKAEYVDHMGTDLSVVNAARVSFDKWSDWEWEGEPGSVFATASLSERDEKLISFLAREKHELPFAHTAITLRMKAPVPIRTQCFKHKVGFVENEESRRYISSRPELFVPEFREKADKVKQGSGGPHPEANDWREIYEYQCYEAIGFYESMIADGVCPEQARFILPQGCEVQWIWTGSLLAYSRFYNLRTDPHAQREVADLARMVGDIIAPLFPVSWKALTNG